MGFFFGKRLFSLPENTFLRKTWLSEAPTRLFSEKIGFRDSRQCFLKRKSPFGDILGQVLVDKEKEYVYLSQY